MNIDISTNLDDWHLAAELLRSEGHETDGDHCPACWQQAIDECEAVAFRRRIFGSTEAVESVMDAYRRIVRETKDRALAKARAA